MKFRRSNLVRVPLLLVPLSLWVGYNVLVKHVGGVQKSFAPHRSRLSDENNSLKPSKNNNNNKHDKHDIRPLFVLHVGPPKTGTTTIQWYAGEHQQLLEMDNIHYLGEYKESEVDVHHLCFSCIMQKDEQCRKMWGELERALEFHHSENHNVLISDENFSRFGNAQQEQEYLWKYLMPMISKKWNVRVLFTYRRYYEWVPSWYYEYYNPNGARGKKKKRFLLWPESRSRGIPSFSKYFEGFMKESYDMVSSLEKWKQHFEDVRVLNMHNGGDNIETFFCDLIPEAKHFCKTLKSKEKSESSTKNQSASKDLHFDMLAVEAYIRGWVKKDIGLSRTDVRRAVEKHTKKLGYKTLQDFPIACLSKKQTDKLLELSVSLESQLVPEFHSSLQGEAELRSGFARAVEANKFCSIDVGSAFKDERLQKFFTGLE